MGQRFSLNKEVSILTSIMTLLKQDRSVQSIGGILNVDINNKQLQASCAGARRKYMLSLDDVKKTKAQQTGVKRKAVSEDTDRLNKLKFSIQKDIDAMRKSADRLAGKAEKLHHITYTAKSNIVLLKTRK